MKTTRLDPFGVQIELDLGRPLAADVIAELRARFYEDHLLVFRGQSLARDRQREIAGYFGHVPADEHDLLFVSNKMDDSLGSVELSYHSDDEYCECPLEGITLFALTVEDDLTTTRIADGVGAYRSLPAALKARVQGLEACHILSADGALRSCSDVPDPRWPHAIHPVVKNHPVTNKPILYVTEFQTGSILGLSEDDSEALIAELCGYLYAPKNVLEHRWRKGDFLIWDNLALQHARGDIGESIERTLQRVSIGLTMVVQYPNFRSDFAGDSQEILNKREIEPA